MRKIVLIGAGSAIFTQGLINDLVNYKDAGKWHLALVDIDEKILDGMVKLCKKIIDYKKSDIELSYSTERKDVLKDADFVVTTIGVGGRRSWESDVFIPRKYGIYQPVGDSVAPGGISRAMRMIPAMVDITRDVMEFCPDAYLFNYSNPMTTICRAVRKETGFPLIGLCHGVKNGQKRISGFTGLDLKDVTAMAVGVNHFVIMYDLRYKGEPAWEFVKDAMKKNDGSNPDARFKLGPLSRAFIKEHNGYPVSDDRHYSEFVGEMLIEDNYFGKKLGIDVYNFENVIAGGDKTYDRILELAGSDESLTQDYFKKFEGEHEQLIEIIDSLMFDKKRLYSVNIPNGCSVKEMPEEAVIEMPALATAKGFVRLQIEGYEPKFSEMINKHLAIAETTVDAALNGDKALFVDAVMAGGCISDHVNAEKMVDELIAAQKQYLPQF